MDKEILAYLLGDIEQKKFVAALIVGALGILFRVLQKISQSQSDSVKTFKKLRCRKFDPLQVTAALLILGSKLLLWPLVTIIGIRFSSELIGVELTMVVAFLIGAFADRVLLKIFGRADEILPDRS